MLRTSSNFSSSAHQVCLALVAGLAASLASGTVGAGDPLLWYDGFVIDDADPGNPETYVSTQSLHLQDGGTGTFFTGPWQQANFNPAIGNMQSEIEDPMSPGDFIAHEDTWVVPNSLTIGGQSLPSTGGKSSDIGIGFGSGECCYTSRTGGQFATPLQTMDDTIYMGFLANFGGGNPADPHYRAIEFWNIGNPWENPGDGALKMSIGFSSFGNYDDPVNDADGPGGTTANRQLSVRVDGVREQFGAIVQTNHQLEEHLEFADQVGQTHSIVIKFDLSTDDAEIGGAGDTVSFFLNPSHDDVVEPTPSLVVSGVDLLLDGMSSNILFHFTGAVSPDPGSFDELRVGRAWGDVAILVPEPSTALLLLGAAGVLAGVRRRQS